MSEVEDLDAAEFAATVVPGKPGNLDVDEQKRFDRWAARNPGLRVVMVLVDEQERGDNRFHRRYRGYILKPFSEWCGYEKNEAHLVLLRLHSTYEHKLKSGRVVPRILHTRRMNEQQFRAFINRCERWLIEQGCPLPQRQERVAS